MRIFVHPPSSCGAPCARAARRAGEHVRFGVAEGDGLEELLEGDRLGFFSSGRESVLSCLADAHGIHDDEVVFGRGVGGDGLQVVRLMTRTPRPFICSKKVRDLTARMKKTISSGLMSVPVAIMSTVTAMRGMVAVAELS